MSYQPDLQGDELTDEEFLQKYKGVFYKTANGKYGRDESDIKRQQGSGLNGKFTAHLIYCGMPKNNSLMTTVDRDRYIDGSKDWMDHLS